MSVPSDPTAYEGRLSDGRSAATMRVDVRFGADGLQILPAGERGAPLVWPYGSLRSSVPLRSDAPDVLLSLKPTGTQTLFVADPAFSRSLRARTSELSPARQRLLGLRTGAVFAVLAAVIVGTGWYLEFRPSQTLARLMPQKMRETMGRNVVASISGGMRQCETAAGRAALDRLTQRLVASGTDQPMPVRVVMVDWALPNAFAAPGGQLVLTRGLVATAGSSDEVAGVLAHELGHALELHPESGLIRSVGLSLAGDLLFAGAGRGGNLGIALMSLRYSRVAEREADVHAVRILQNAGISAKGFGDFFERIEATYGVPRQQKKAGATEKRSGSVVARLETILSTHPLTKERLAMVRSQPDYPATPALSDADWRALREMCAGSSPARRPLSGPPETGRRPGSPADATPQEPETPRGGTKL